MSGSIKISTAIVICSVFIFRLLFINIGILSSLHSRQNQHTKRVSGVMKRRRNIEVSNDSRNFEYLAAEICEEGSKEDSQLKINSLLLLKVFYTLFTDKITSALKKSLPSYTHLSYTSLHKYVALQVFRV